MQRTLLAVLAAATALTAPAFAQTRADDDRLTSAQQRFDREVSVYRQEVERYRSIRSGRRTDGRYGYDDRRPNYNDDQRAETDYEPERYYRDGTRYQERVLASDERVYRGNDGRYYCRRSDGTTGLIVGAAGGGLLGNVIAGGSSSTVGTLLGAAIGAIAGRTVERSQQEIRCR